MSDASAIAANPAAGGLLDALATALAAATGVEYAGKPRELWLYQADEAQCPTDDEGRIAAHAWLTPYGGGQPFVPLATVAVQCRAVAPTNAAGESLSQRLFTALLDGEGRPRRNWILPAAGGDYRVVGVANLRRPGLLGRDAKGRGEWVFNFDLRAHRRPAAA